MLHLIIVILVSLGLITGIGCNISSKNKTVVTENIYIPNDSMPKLLTKKEIEVLLKNLSKSNPDSLSLGAMCYSRVAPPKTADYICPTCGEKSLYTTNSEFFIWELPQIRASVKNNKFISIKLDESQFCKKCSPKIENPQLCITLKLEDENEKLTCGISNEDLIILNEFFNGSEKHSTSNGAEVPLKNYYARIEELLGVKIEK